MQINLNPLIYNSDIRIIEKKAETGVISNDELELLRLGKNCKETLVQSRIVLILKALEQELKLSWRDSNNDFIIAQRENAAATKFQRIKRAREGSHAKMPDLDIFLGNGKETKAIFIECKRVESPSVICGSNKQTKEHYIKQIECHERLRKMGFSVYLTNNPVYVRRVICEEIRQFFR